RRDRAEVGLTIRQLEVLLPDNRTARFPDVPWTVGLAREQAHPGAELLTIEELKVEPDTRTQLVASFACTTGVGQPVGGDDYSSLAHQWLKTGASSVLANLWSLDFEFIRHWSDLFLSNLLEYGQPKAVAWRQATREALADYPDPYQWGVISLFG